MREGVGTPGEKWARLEPFHGYKLSFEITFDHPAVDSTGIVAVAACASGQASKPAADLKTLTASLPPSLRDRV